MLELENFYKIKDVVPFGSRALKVNKISGNVDYDFACTLENSKEVLDNYKIYEEDLKTHYSSSRYFDIVPIRYDIYTLLKLPVKDKNIFVDLVIYEKDEDLNVVKKAMLDMYKIPKYLLREKYLRVDLFERALLNHGFIKKEDKEGLFDENIQECGSC